MNFIKINSNAKVNLSLTVLKKLKSKSTRKRLSAQSYKDFEDKYLQGIKIDLSKILKVFTMNDAANISDKALLDRLNIIQVKG